MEEELLSKDLFNLPPKGKALFNLFVIAIISVIAFVSAFADQQESKLEVKGLKHSTINQNVSFEFRFAVRKPRPAGNSFDEVTGTFTIRVRTQPVIQELREDPLNDEQRTQADVKLLFCACKLNRMLCIEQVSSCLPIRVNLTKCQSKTLRMERSKGNWNHHLM